MSFLADEKQRTNKLLVALLIFFSSLFVQRGDQEDLNVCKAFIFFNSFAIIIYRIPNPSASKSFNCRKCSRLR